MIDFEIPEPLSQARYLTETVAENMMRPVSRYFDDNEHEVPWDYINFMHQAISSMGGTSMAPEEGKKEEQPEKQRPSLGYQRLAIMVEMLSWGDVGIYLCTPGGLLDSTRAIVSRMITSRAPVVVFVGPSGARAASAGFVITLAADVAVMAPGTHIGAAHPVSGSGQPVDETTAKKAASDTAAYVRSLAEARGRNVALAADAVLESRAFTDREALQASPALIDFAAPDVADILRQLDGRTVRRFDGRAVTLETSNIEMVQVEMTRRQRFLSAIAHHADADVRSNLNLFTGPDGQHEHRSLRAA